MRSCAIATASPNPLIAPNHNRMPDPVDEEAEALWLYPCTKNPESCPIRPYPSVEMETYRVCQAINSSRDDWGIQWKLVRTELSRTYWARRVRAITFTTWNHRHAH
ncbi:MAG: SOS response-associated peptidase family protein [Chloroflexota bacterium]